MDGTNSKGDSKISLHTMEEDLKAAVSTPVSTRPKIPVAREDAGAPSFPNPSETQANIGGVSSAPKEIPPSAPNVSATMAQITIPEANPLRKRIITIFIFVGVALVVFGAGVGIFFWLREGGKEVAIATPTPSFIASPTLSPIGGSPSPKTSVIYPTATVIFDGTAAVIEYKSADNLSQVLISKIPLIAQEGKAIRILLRQMDYPDGPRFTYLNNVLNALGIKVNAELSKLMSGAGDLFVYEDEGNYRLGFVSHLSGAESFSSLSGKLQENESGFIADFSPMFLGAKFQNSLAKTFKTNSQISPNFVNRYVNLINLPANNLSLDYAINKSANLFILATSKNSMFHLINLAEGKK